MSNNKRPGKWEVQPRVAEKRPRTKDPKSGRKAAVPLTEEERLAKKRAQYREKKSNTPIKKEISARAMNDNKRQRIYDEDGNIINQEAYQKMKERNKPAMTKEGYRKLLQDHLDFQIESKDFFNDKAAGMKAMPLYKTPGKVVANVQEMPYCGIDDNGNFFYPHVKIEEKLDKDGYPVVSTKTTCRKKTTREFYEENGKKKSRLAHHKDGTVGSTKITGETKKSVKYIARGFQGTVVKSKKAKTPTKSPKKATTKTPATKKTTKSPTKSPRKKVAKKSEMFNSFDDLISHIKDPDSLAPSDNDMLLLDSQGFEDILVNYFGFSADKAKESVLNSTHIDDVIKNWKKRSADKKPKRAAKKKVGEESNNPNAKFDNDGIPLETSAAPKKKEKAMSPGKVWRDKKYESGKDVPAKEFNSAYLRKLLQSTDQGPPSIEQIQNVKRMDVLQRIVEDFWGAEAAGKITKSPTSYRDFILKNWKSRHSM